MERRRDVPLFPLQQPLFPTVTLQLRIFEQRYLNLVRKSLREGSPFGIVPILKGREVGQTPEIHPWGTLVTITDWDQLNDGLLGIAVSGNQCLRVDTHHARSDGLLVADCDLYGPDPEEALEVSDQDLVALLDDLAGQLGRTDLHAGDNCTVSMLGWRLLTLLPFELQWRLQLFEERNPRTRLDAIRDYLTRLSQV